jgi:hypothetical protein
MFIPFQVLFSLIVGAALLSVGVNMLRTQDTKQGHSWQGWLCIVLGVLALLWFPLVALDEAARTRTDSEGTYITPR